MSDSQAYEEVTGSSDGVTVIKRFEEDEFPVPAIAFEFTSERDEPVQVTVSDTVPESVAVEDLGFHPEYGSEYWTIDEDEITFERELDANAAYTTVYGIRATGTDDVEKFLTVPEISDVDPPLPGEDAGETAADGDDVGDVIPESEDDVVRDVISDESEDVPGLDDESDEEIETLDLKDPNDGGSPSDQTSAETTPSESATDADSDPDEPDDETAPEVSGDSLVEALATEIRQNNVSAEDVKLLRQAFEIAGQEGGSIQARVERLQSDVADLRAYSDAMEEFLDDNGTTQQLIDEFESDLETLENSIDGMEATIEDNSEEVSAISDEVSSLGNDVAEISGEVEDVSEDVGDVEGSVAELEESLSEIEQTMDDLRQSVTEEDVGDRLKELETEIEDLRTWQDQIKETFGG